MTFIGKPVRRIEVWPVVLPKPLRKADATPELDPARPKEPVTPEPEKIPAGNPV